MTVHDAFRSRGCSGGVIESNGGPLVVDFVGDEIGVAAEKEVFVFELAEADAGGEIEVVDDDDERERSVGMVVAVGLHEEAEGVTCLGDEFVVDEENLCFGMTEDGGDVVGVEAGVYRVEDGAGHWHGEVHLV